MKYGRQEIGVPQPGQNVTPDGRRWPHSGQKTGTASGAAPERSVPGGPAEAVGTGGAPTVVAPKGSAAGGMACAGTQGALFLRMLRITHAMSPRQAADSTPTSTL